MITRFTVREQLPFGVQVSAPEVATRLLLIMFRKCPGVTLPSLVDKDRLPIRIETPHLLAQSRVLSGVIAFAQARNDRERMIARETTLDQIQRGWILRRSINIFRNRQSYRYEITDAGATLTIGKVEPMVRATILAELYNALRPPSLPEVLIHNYVSWVLGWESLHTAEIPDRLQDLSIWLSSMRTDVTLTKQLGRGLTSPEEAERVLLSLIERNGAVVVDREQDQLQVEPSGLISLLDGEVYHYGDSSAERHMITEYLRDHQLDYIRIEPNRAIIDLAAVRQLPAKYPDPHLNPDLAAWIVSELLARIYYRIGATDGIQVRARMNHGKYLTLVTRQDLTLTAPSEVKSLLAHWDQLVGQPLAVWP